MTFYINMREQHLNLYSGPFPISLSFCLWVCPVSMYHLEPLALPLLLHVCLSSYGVTWRCSRNVWVWHWGTCLVGLAGMGSSWTYDLKDSMISWTHLLSHSGPHLSSSALHTGLSQSPCVVPVFWFCFLSLLTVCLSSPPPVSDHPQPFPCSMLLIYVCKQICKKRVCLVHRAQGDAGEISAIFKPPIHSKDAGRNPALCTQHRVTGCRIPSNQQNEQKWGDKARHWFICGMQWGSFGYRSEKICLKADKWDDSSLKHLLYCCY